MYRVRLRPADAWSDADTNEPPRFAPDARAANMAVVDLLKRIGQQKHAQGPWIVPIPGTGKRERLDEHIGAASVA